MIYLEFYRFIFLRLSQRFSSSEEDRTCEEEWTGKEDMVVQKKIGQLRYRSSYTKTGVKLGVVMGLAQN